MEFPRNVKDTTFIILLILPARHLFALPLCGTYVRYEDILTVRMVCRIPSDLQHLNNTGIMCKSMAFGTLSVHLLIASPCSETGTFDGF